MLYGIFIGLHVIVSLILIAVILLQAGRGGGLSETFGGSSTQTILGTKTSVFLKRATATSAVIYILTCLILAVMTSHRGRSLVSKGVIAPVTQGQGTAPQPFANDMVDF
ncbi:MAG: preprotein translocase subunit SecG [Candidatus Omnitrophica bacterium]|nr:preprotein translocase subunit SecG [Candidatus Omnitrophota bacterium]